MKSDNKIDFRKIIFSSNLFLFLILLILIAISLSVVNVSYRRYLLNKEIKSLQSRMDNLQKNNQDLSKALEYYNMPEFIEKEARSRFNLKKEGETVIIVPNQTKSK